jgi:hypothetical protein
MSKSNLQMQTIITPNGIKANDVLNSLCDKLDTKWKSLSHMKYWWEIGFDGHWELLIKNTKTDKGICLKQHPDKNKQWGMVYSSEMSNQSKAHDLLFDIQNKDVLYFVEFTFNSLNKNK